ncbi:hypothetical protein [Streptomyces griseoloalbus]|uniref:Uncharacterized protein n=1 Tax=Streptomyces griseoloalbus TaxID=67303 RepID=A0A7W8BLZ0_9ACTN|nr:hypothetical protein [Streptomyces albaduncus]MBB5123884.1 hypothetical protein [Streptomyces albaduncus]GGW77857.1 hypothetical protein GCM10010340_65560 [Streptomyces albaduncus]
MSYGIDWDDDFDDRVTTYCPLCHGAYMPKWGTDGAYFGHVRDCAARILPTETLLRLYRSEADVRAEIDRRRSTGSP